MIGWGRTRQLLLTGDTIDAETAHAWGLVEELVPVDQLDQTVDRLVVSILESGPRAIRLQKALITAWEDLPLGDAIQRGIDSFVDAWDSDEPRKLMGEFIKRRRRTG